ncbi:MAG: hypothetical protein H0W12_12775 [Chitinophagaceae bacterium]|nr:hypothetical protein [Chitinophagaceae bacterium]
MKKGILLSVLSITFLFSSAKIWRVNNVPGVAADFTTAQAAHNGAAANDTIYLESSPTSYGDLTTSKKLTWIGLGYFLPQNPGLQFHSNTGFTGTIQVNPGSDGSVFEIAHLGSYFTITSCANITLQRCYIESGLIVTGTTNHLTINQCYLNVGNGVMNIQPTSQQFGFTITNNIIRVNQIIINANAYQVTFNNNTLFSNGNPPNSTNIYDNSTISNNIFYGVSTSTLYDAGYPSNVTNNLWVQYNNPTFVGTNGNIFASTFASVFVGGSSPDGQYKLVAGSPAIGTGAGGVDMGAYGSANPYILSMIPAIPTIYQLSVPANATGNTLPSTVSTRANN